MLACFLLLPLLLLLFSSLFFSSLALVAAMAGPHYPFLSFIREERLLLGVGLDLEVVPHPYTSYGSLLLHPEFHSDWRFGLLKTWDPYGSRCGASPHSCGAPKHQPTTLKSSQIQFLSLSLSLLHIGSPSFP